jgi:hypothetical protein
MIEDIEFVDLFFMLFAMLISGFLMGKYGGDGRG